MLNLTGKTLKKRYKVIESLGRGGMAEVYKAYDKKRADHLAVKVLRDDLARDKIFLRRFQREAQTLAKLQHRSIVRFYGLEQEGMDVFILMDYIEGESLRDEIFRASKPFSSTRVLEIMEPVCSALYYAHQMGIAHCDIKPGNILISKKGDVLVTDFGIARMVDSATSTMVGIGSPAYMAPELVRGQDPTPQSDIYSLGIVLYEMLTGGERPFTGDRATIIGTTAEKVRWEQVRLAPGSPRKFNKNISPEMEAVVLRCLEKKPGKRFGSSMDLLGAVRQPISGKEAKKSSTPVRAAKRSAKPKAPQVESRTSGTPIWGRWYLWMGLAAIAVVLLLTQITPPPLEIPATPMNTPPATAIPTRTSTPSLVPTMVTEKDISSFLPDSLTDAKIIYTEEFNDSFLSGWDRWGNTYLNLRDGSLFIDGDSSWPAAVRTSLIHEGEALLVFFRYSKQTQFEIMVDSGEYNTHDYRAWGMMKSDTERTFITNLEKGDQWVGGEHITGNLIPQHDHWYVALLQVVSQSDFKVWVWDAGDASKYGEKLFIMDSDWEDRGWRGYLSAESGLLEVDTYYELQIQE